MSANAITEARRQIEICNACRYCEGYCAVFPAITRQRQFSDGDITQLANLCHNCRGCYYACQYIEPHEFALNVPKALADVRQDSWQQFAWPASFARIFQNSGTAIATLLVLCFALIFLVSQAMRPASGEGFYAYLSHGMMVAIFLPAFLVPLFSISVSMRRYWRQTGGGKVTSGAVVDALRAAGSMRNLSGGHGKGCNFEDEDRFTNGRRHCHQATLYGFLLCFASTSVATVMHYVFNLPAPYPFLSAPKLLGITGGILLCAGTAGIAILKLKSDRALGAAGAWGGEMAFTLLLFFVSATGLALYAATGTGFVSLLLAVHLGAVLAFFLLMPYSKMVHGAYRIAALIYDAQAQQPDIKASENLPDIAKSQRS